MTGEIGFSRLSLSLDHPAVTFPLIIIFFSLSLSILRAMLVDRESSLRESRIMCVSLILALLYIYTAFYERVPQQRTTRRRRNRLFIERERNHTANCAYTIFFFLIPVCSVLRQNRVGLGAAQRVSGVVMRGTAL